ncbi:ROK family glucokinase [Mordavella massiliensis]|uniref:Glucokinase n=1 Tax=Mordavella massiliensis TaxID=1871024 RepID=A0A938XDZ8_9CLOT|nr:ROK family glucokinase [Mordavella massiliensis]MBM6948257.1 ROK family glucokinase [Mordavella massiliensis]
MKYCFGVDVGGTTVKMGLFSPKGELFEKWEIRTRTEDEGRNVLPDIAASIRAKMEERGISASDTVGVGMGVPAPVKDGIVKNTANLGWGYKNVKKELEELLPGIRARIGNDANVAALGEMWLGAGKGCQDMVMVTLGTGVGGGVICHGNILDGAHGAGGEIGHICVNYEETQACGCGRKGCLEQYASATGIARLARIRLSKPHGKTLLEGKNISAKTVFDAVKQGDETATEIAEEFGRYLGYALANLAVVADPERIVIGGGVSHAGEALLPFIEKPFREKAFFANMDTQIVLATLGNDAGICGAARLII